MQGEKITIQEGRLKVPSQPIIPFIEGDGIGPDIWAAAVRVIDAAVEKAYNGERKIIWKEVYAGEKANEKTGSYLPEETLETLKEHLVGIKGPLTTPVGGGFRSLNVALRQKLDLFACVRPVRWFNGVPSPVKKPQDVDMVIFRENTEDIYAGIEYNHGTPEVEQVKDFLINEMGVSEIRFPKTASIGIKPVSKEGTERLIKAAMDYTIAKGRKSLTIVHKGNIMKFTEGMFKSWAYDFCEANYGDKVWTWQQYDAVKEAQGTEAADAAQRTALANGAILIKDSIADAFLQQILLRPTEYDVIATLNLNGDYISDALAAMVGGIGIAPGANINYSNGISLFEATHGTAPKYKGMDKVNPSSVILSGVMMLDFMGWSEAGDIIEKGIEGAIAKKRVTYDFERLMEGATTLKCSEFATEIIENLGEPVFSEKDSSSAIIFAPVSNESTPTATESNSKSNDVNVVPSEASTDAQESNSESPVLTESTEESNNSTEEVVQKSTPETYHSTPQTHNEEVLLNEVSTESTDRYSHESTMEESITLNEEVAQEATPKTYHSTPHTHHEEVVLNEETNESTEFASNESSEVITHVVTTVEDSIPVVQNSGEVSTEIAAESHNLSSETIDSNPVAFEPNIPTSFNNSISELENRNEANNVTPESIEVTPKPENPSVVLLSELSDEGHESISESEHSNNESL